MNKAINIETVAEIQNGSEKAFSAIHKQLSSYVRSCVARWISSHRTLAMYREDIVQDIVVKIHKNIGEYEPTFKFETWVHKVTKNHIIDLVRKSSNMQSFEVLTDVDIPIENDDTRMEQCLLLDEIVKHSKLSPMQIEVMKLRFIKEMKCKDIALELNMPVDTVKVHIFRLKQELRMTTKEKNFKSPFKKVLA